MRVRDWCEECARTGTKTARAVFPGAFSRPVSAIRAHSSQKCRVPASWHTGTTLSVTQQVKSEVMLTRLAPARSTIAPPKSELTAVGSIVQRATTPALPALPVVSSTSQGTPIWVMPSPEPDSTVAPRRTRNGRAPGALSRCAGDDRFGQAPASAATPRRLEAKSRHLTPAAGLRGASFPVTGRVVMWLDFD
jgi:hypothetical protein